MPCAFVDELLARMPTPEAKLRCLSVLHKWAGEQVYLPANLEAPRRVQAAANMIGNGKPDGEIVRVLRERFNVSSRTGWRDVHAAKQMSQKNGANDPDI